MPCDLCCLVWFFFLVVVRCIRKLAECEGEKKLVDSVHYKQLSQLVPKECVDDWREEESTDQPLLELLLLLKGVCVVVNVESECRGVQRMYEGVWQLYVSALGESAARGDAS